MTEQLKALLQQYHTAETTMKVVSAYDREFNHANFFDKAESLTNVGTLVEAFHDKVVPSSIWEVHKIEGSIIFTHDFSRKIYYVTEVDFHKILNL